MFALLPDQKIYTVPPEMVVAVIESLNTPNIAVLGMGAEPTHAYILGARTPSERFIVLIHLVRADGTECMYAPTEGEVPTEGYGALEREACEWAESMGFMLDNRNFHAVTPAEQQRILVSLPMFRPPDLPPPPPPPTAAMEVGPLALEPTPGAQERPFSVDSAEARAVALLLGAF